MSVHMYLCNLPVCINLTSQTRAPADYRLRYHDPEGCDPESCNYFMGIDTNEGNSSFLDFYLTAVIDGWVAVGFSETANMVCFRTCATCLAPCMYMLPS